MTHRYVVFLVLAALQSSWAGSVLSIVDFGAVSDEAVTGIHQQVLFKEFHEEEEEQQFFTADLGVQQNIPTNVTKINTRAFSDALAAARPGDTVLVPEDQSFSFNGGIVGRYLDHVTIDISGAMHFVHNQSVWPTYSMVLPKGLSGNHWGYKPCFNILDSTNLTITSSSNHRPTVTVKGNQVYLDQSAGSAGIINGNGKIWWDEAILGRLPHKDPDFRPRLMLVEGCVDCLIERLTLLNSPYWTMTVEAVRAEIRHINVLVDRKYQGDLWRKKTLRRLGTLPPWFPNDIPDWVGRRIHQPEDLNTDGIDPRGRDIWVHDCVVQNADDSVAVKPGVWGKSTRMLNGTIPVPCTTNVTVENMILTGFGASIGSVQPSVSRYCVDGVVFRNISMPGTGKGIYVKSNPSSCQKDDVAIINNIVYEDVYIKSPFWWAIWIGPQQQHEPKTSLGNDCPLAYPLPGSTHCPTQGCANFSNIIMRNIRIEDPFLSPGVIMGNETNPMKNVVFENLTVTFSRWKPWHGKWPFHDYSYPFNGVIKCWHATGTCRNCSLVPSCLEVIPETM